MSAQHTPEPWRIEDGDSIYGGEDFNSNVWERYQSDIPDHDLCRIVACVNACAGMTNEELEDFSDGSLKFWIDDADDIMKSVCVALLDVDYLGRCEHGIYALKKQRDELLAALQAINNIGRGLGHDAHTIINEAIAKAQGYMVK